MILAFAHPCLVVPDLERAREFYEQMFGFEMLSNEGWSDDPDADRATGLKESACRGYMLKGHNCFLELFEFTAPESENPQSRFPHANDPGIRHLAFFVDDCWQEYDRLQRLGGLAMGVPAGDAENGYAVYCRDPFGNIIELAEIPNPEECPTRLPGVSRLANALETA
jgi:catechol 2,3-dioxygenase-like lactoylglutathione lyase family enzyme